MKIFVLCPSDIQTGGPELLHQLVSKLKARGYLANMVYINPMSKRETDCPVHEAYRKYGTTYVSDYVDSEDSVLIAPETGTSGFVLCRKGVRVLWWLSVDNYKGSIDFQKDKSILHLVQSKYAEKFLLDQGVDEKRIYWLSDYLNESFFAQEEADGGERSEEVLYNPKKGYEFTQRLIDHTKGKVRWRPIENMSRREVAQLLRHSKLYVDFGEHPGKDRIPREAAISGCCVITGRKGSAGFYEDVPIDDRYKIAGGGWNGGRSRCNTGVAPRCA